MKKLAALCALALAGSCAQAANFLVTNNGNDGYGSLRWAITEANNADDEPHSISFSGGLYPNGSAIVLLSPLPPITATDLYITGGAANPVVDGNELHRVMYASDSNQKLHLANLELRNGAVDYYGACLGTSVGSSTGQLIIESSTFRNCVASGSGSNWGGAVSWGRTNGLVQVTGSRFHDNVVEAVGSGGKAFGGALRTAGQLEVTSSWFEGNRAKAGEGFPSGGAIQLYGDSPALITDSTFIGNWASPAQLGHGGAIDSYCTPCIMIVERNWFRGNAATVGGAVFARDFGGDPGDTLRLVLTNNSFYNNSAAERGGAVAVDAAEFEMVNNSFYNNDAADGSHLDLKSGQALGFRANLLAPTYAGDACSSYVPTVLFPGAVRLNLFDDSSCAALSADALPASDLGTFQLEERAYGDDLSLFWFDGTSVIDAIADASACDAEDALGNPRPFDGNGDMTAECDLGAFEYTWVLGPPIDAWIFTDGFED